MKATLDSEIDAYVGAKIMTRRRELGLSQTALAKTMGITFQQLQKYEHATNRISASKLWLAARTLNKPCAWFFPPVGEDGRPVLGEHAVTRT